jgi:glycine/D-amino acid oxidase-like deaminating enzyme
MTTAVVIGGGLGGLACAIGLRRAGCDVEVYEQAPVARLEGRSISLWSNGMAALAALGVNPVRAQTIERMLLTDGLGRVLVQFDLAGAALRHGYPCINIWRQDLLADLIRTFDGVVHFDKTCVGVESRVDSPARVRPRSFARVLQPSSASRTSSATAPRWYPCGRRGNQPLRDTRLRMIRPPKDEADPLRISPGTSSGSPLTSAGAESAVRIVRLGRFLGAVTPAPTGA